MGYSVYSHCGITASCTGCSTAITPWSISYHLHTANCIGGSRPYHTNSSKLSVNTNCCIAATSRSCSSCITTEYLPTYFRARMKYIIKDDNE
ncbi:hypothetical protein H8959_011393 [Pygathrix nigripes]